ncbi:hypothetical protein [Streptomyces sp. 900105755]
MSSRISRRIRRRRNQRKWGNAGSATSVGVDGEPLHELGGQRRVLGEGRQVRPLGDAPLGAGAREEPSAQRLGG